MIYFGFFSSLSLPIEVSSETFLWFQYILNCCCLLSKWKKTLKNMCARVCVCVHLCACSCTDRCVCVHMYAFTCGDQRTASHFILRNIMHLLWNMVSHCLGTQQVFLTFWPVCHRDLFFSAFLVLEFQVYTTVLCSTRLHGWSNSGSHACVVNIYGLRPLPHLWRTILIRFVKMPWI